MKIPEKFRDERGEDEQTYKEEISTNPMHHRQVFFIDSGYRSVKPKDRCFGCIEKFDQNGAGIVSLFFDIRKPSKCNEIDQTDKCSGGEYTQSKEDVLWVVVGCFGDADMGKCGLFILGNCLVVAVEACKIDDWNEEVKKGVDGDSSKYLYSLLLGREDDWLGNGWIQALRGLYDDLFRVVYDKDRILIFHFDLLLYYN
jgi:hypothetical protein